MLITPAIFPESFEHIVNDLFLLEGLCEQVQIDICDGVMGLEKTWLPYQEKELPHGFLYEFDMMVNDWRKYLPRVIGLGSKRFVMHVDTWADDDLEEMIAISKEHGLYLGLSVCNDIPIRLFLEKVQFVESRYSKVYIQVMGIKKIGAQGQPFDENVLERISSIKREFPSIAIQVDGSMNGETILKVKNRGAVGVVVGSYLLGKARTHEEVRKRYERLVSDF